MKIFLSYRRGDTGGRAGRLYDLLVARFGVDDVFQDVNAIAPGLDFADQVEQAIGTSDVVLVVMGPNWIGAVEEGSGSRIDSPDDFVRQEVRAALAAHIPVVPILVDDAALPDAGSLPADVSPLLLRQAVTLRDASWHDDVQGLVRRLSGDHRLAARPRRWPVAVVAGVVVLVVGLSLAIIVWRSGGESSYREPPPCVLDETWEEVGLVDDASHVVVDAGDSVEFEVRRALVRSDATGGAVVLDVAATNLNGPQPDGDSSVYFSSGWIEGLVVDRVVQTSVSCWGPVRGELNMQPDQTAIVTMGFQSDTDPVGKSIALELSDLATLPVTAAR